jgi:tetratricopeptide (TPR) repeat protein
MRRAMLFPKSGQDFRARFVSLLIMLLVYPGFELSAQNTADPILVSGTVRTASGEPVAGAMVSLDEQTSAAHVETKTNSDGTFVLSLDRAGTYKARAAKSNLRGSSKEPLVLAAGEKTRLDLVLAEQSGPVAMELKDDPDFTVAGVTDWSNVGLHGSDTTSRTSETLAKETLGLKSGAAGKKSVVVSGTYQAALEREAQGEFVKAREEIRKKLAASDDAEGHHLLGDLDERLNDPLDAVREYERAARMSPSEQNYFDWGTELLLHKAAQPAVEVFTKGTDLHRNSARMLAGLGAALYAVGSYDDAARRLCAASDLRPAESSPYLFLGQMEKTVSAALPCSEEKLARFAREQPANAQANYYYAIALWKRQRGSENPASSRQVQALLEKAVKLKPEFGEAYVQLGVVYFARNDFAAATQAYRQAIQVSPQLSEAHYRLSLAYKRTGEDAKAHQEFAAYQQAEKTETAAVERQRSELKQFLVILKSQPATSLPQ